MNAAEENKKISFVIPTYNAAKHLNRCLESIVSQNYPRQEIEIIIADGGSSDETIQIATRFNCRILDNAKRLAEYGVQIGVKEATGDFLVVFAADNELVGSDWIQKVVTLFESNHEISAVWGRLVSGPDDPALNKYFELIQSDPLSWFINNNLADYKSHCDANGVAVFTVDSQKPLVWGANGLVYRAGRIKAVWTQGGYLGDNDAFQTMLENKDNVVAYFDLPFVYHPPCRKDS